MNQVRTAAVRNNIPGGRGTLSGNNSTWTRSPPSRFIRAASLASFSLVFYGSRGEGGGGETVEHLGLSCRQRIQQSSVVYYLVHTRVATERTMFFISTLCDDEDAGMRLALPTSVGRRQSR